MGEKVLASGLDRHVLPTGEMRETELNAASDEQRALPFYPAVPKDPLDCLRWKIYVRQRCLHDLEFRELILEACRRDPCFFANTLCWVFEPRPPRGIPLTLWTDQADCLTWMAECVETRRDCGIEKTRGIGMSWTLSVLYYWLWCFTPDCKLGLMTKDETVLDGPDANTLIGKFAYIHDNMPAWLRYDSRGKPILKRTLNDHLLVNLSNGATLQGFPPMESKVRSLRFTVFAYDEFAYFPRDAQESLNASVHTAPTRFFVSTWHGHNNAFHQIMRVEKSTMLAVQTYWWNNPDRWQGCYTTENNRLKVIDENYPFPPDYPFVLDGMIRSPWVDYELSRAGSKMQSALEELYGLAAEEGRKLLRASTIRIAETTILPPRAVGDLDVSTDEPRFMPGDGNLKLWGDLGDGKGGPYAAGCDLALGLGASYSTLEVIDLAGGYQVLEYKNNEMDPTTFARFVVAACRWLAGSYGDGHVYLTFENNGTQGTVFGRELQRLGYGNVARRKYNRKVPRTDELTYMGIRNKDGGLAILAELERAIRDGDVSLRSDELIAELETFGKDEQGKPQYPQGQDGHGDLAFGAAMAWWEAVDRVQAEPAKKQATAHDELLKVGRPGRRAWSSGWRLRG